MLNIPQADQIHITEFPPKKALAMRKFIALGVAGLILIVGFLISGSLVENVPAGSICVIQSPISGDLDIYTEPGLKWQGFGKVTLYPRSGIYEFLAQVDPDDESESSQYDARKDKSIKIQFNDSGSGWVSGSIRYDYPLEVEKIRELHKMFQGHPNVLNGLIKPNIERVIYMTGPLMSSIESSRTRKSDIPKYIEDQARNGLYEVRTLDVKTTDEITGEEKTVKIAELIIDSSTGDYKRQSGSILTKYGLNMYNLNIDKLFYEKKVQERLDALFAADSEKQLAYMQALKAEQDKKTAEEKGKAEATSAEWRAKAVTAEQKEAADREKQIRIINSERDKEVALIEANRKREVAEQEKLTAALYKDAQLLRADADATYRKKILEADGALEKKLETYKEVQSMYAKALASYQGAWVPQIVTGGAGSSNNAAMDMMNFLSIKAAKDLGLDMSMSKK